MASRWVVEAVRGVDRALYSWRGHIFVPVEHVDVINRKLNVAWNDSGDDLSVPMSSNGLPPASYMAASGALNASMLEGLDSIISAHRGALALIISGATHEHALVQTVLGDENSGLVGKSGLFWDFGDALGLKRFLSAIPERLPSSLLLQTIVTLGANSNEGTFVEAVALPWFAIATEIERDPEFLKHFPKHSRAFEEFLAGAYEREGYDVILTPRSGDGGRDVIATKSGFASVRILEQAKAYSPGHLVTHNDVRAMIGVLATDRNASKGIITTTSDFQPGIFSGDEFQPFFPYRLELKNGTQLREWIAQLIAEQRLKI